LFTADSLEASVSNILKGLSKHQVEQLIENFKRKVEIAKKERNIRRDQGGCYINIVYFHRSLTHSLV